MGSNEIGEWRCKEPRKRKKEIENEEKRIVEEGGDLGLKNDACIAQREHIRHTYFMRWGWDVLSQGVKM